MRNGIRKAIEREARAEQAREMPKHSRSLVHVLNAIAKRAEAQKQHPSMSKRSKQSKRKQAQ